MKYNFVIEPPQPKKAIVITPTVGSEKLKDTIAGVDAQTYSNVEHLIVCDGMENWERLKQLQFDAPKNHPVNITNIPFNTGHGAQGFYGHRIYAAFAHLVDHDYIFFCDDDNWFRPDHVETLVKTLEEGNDFAFSLRQIYDKDKNYLCDDNCESLGKWPIYFTHGKEEHFLIDTSSFAFRREFLIKVSQFWHHGWGGDRHFFYNVKDFAKYNTNGKHTLCYRLDGNPNSVTATFFEQGNEAMKTIYGDKFPWIKD